MTQTVSALTKCRDSAVKKSKAMGWRVTKVTANVDGRTGKVILELQAQLGNSLEKNQGAHYPSPPPHTHTLLLDTLVYLFFLLLRERLGCKEAFRGALRSQRMKLVSSLLWGKPVISFCEFLR